MGEQLSLLAETAGDSGTITVQILPFDSGAHAAAGDGSLALLQFAEAPGLGLVHLGGIGGATTSQATPSEVSSRRSSKPRGPAS